MTPDDNFLQAILDAPDDDGPRLVYADYLEEQGDPRGEFIRLQCELARLPDGDPRRRGLRGRDRDLLTEHRGAWLGPLRGVLNGRGFLTEPQFHRGFLSAVAMEADDFLHHAEALFRLGPVRHAALSFHDGRPEDSFRRLEASPFLPRLADVAFSFGCCEVSDPALLSLASCRNLLGRLGRLDVLECHISHAGLWPVLASPWLGRLRALHLVKCGDLGEPGCQVVAASPGLGHLRSLWLEGSYLGRDAGAGALAASPNCGRLDCLGLAYCGLGPAGLEALVASPFLQHLHHLDVRGNRSTEEVGEALRARFGDRVHF